MVAVDDELTQHPSGDLCRACPGCKSRRVRGGSIWNRSFDWATTRLILDFVRSISGQVSCFLSFHFIICLCYILDGIFSVVFGIWVPKSQTSQRWMPHPSLGWVGGLGEAHECEKGCWGILCRVGIHGSHLTSHIGKGSQMLKIQTPETLWCIHLFLNLFLEVFPRECTRTIFWPLLDQVCCTVA